MESENGKICNSEFSEKIQISINSLTTKKQMTKFLSANFHKVEVQAISF